MYGPPPKHLYSVHFDVVHGCQLRCVGCPNSTRQPKVHRIAVDDFAHCLGNIDVERIHTLRLFNFGEPLLHKQLSQIVAQIPRQRWQASAVEISTNAQWVYWDDFEEMLKQQVVTKLFVSCDGDGTPEIYERLRPPAQWTRLMDFLGRAAVLRDRWAPTTQLWTRTLIRTPEDARRWESILRPRGWTPEFRRWMPLPQARENLSGRAAAAPRGSCVFLCDAKDFVAPPELGEINVLYVDADGAVLPCCMHPRAAILGNLMMQPYSAILNGDGRRRFKQAMQTDRSALRVCGGCAQDDGAALSVCGGSSAGPTENYGPSHWSAIGHWNFGFARSTPPTDTRLAAEQRMTSTPHPLTVDG
jgi:radical SAM protein with 4Fe4S-binding SPASM domain